MLTQGWFAITAVAVASLAFSVETDPTIPVPLPRAPVERLAVHTNTGDEGVPLTFRWDAIPDAACYDLQVSYDMFEVPVFDTAGQRVPAQRVPT